jgi:hypothetical protein
MKRPNLFLTLTAGCLAVASFTFAKAHKLGSANKGRCMNPANAKCTISTTGKHWSIVAAGSGVATCNNGKTARTAVNCVKTLYTRNC